MQNVLFEKGICSVQWGVGQSPRSWGIFENFRVKSNLTVCNVNFNCKLQKNGEQDILDAPSTAPPAPPVPAAMASSFL